MSHALLLIMAPSSRCSSHNSHIKCQRLGLQRRFPRVVTEHVPQDGKQAGKRTAPICYDFVKGLCTRGAECRYSHDLNSIIHSARGSAGSTTDVCYDFTRCALLNRSGFSAWPGTLLQLGLRVMYPTIPNPTPLLDILSDLLAQHPDCAVGRRGALFLGRSCPAACRHASVCSSAS